tara:strand:+ start:56 stop:388 length:333 start_codon:yes stop_codon:yes gene_type:complete
MTQKLPSTYFHKELFHKNGEWLTYGNNLNDEVFIARFKYGRRPFSKWINFLCKNFTVAEYKELSEATSPREAMESKGYFDEVTVNCLQAKLETRNNRIAELQKQLQEATK